MTFEELGLSPLLLEAVDALGYTEPTPIQRDAIPVILSGKDVVGTAQTGTGKTAAFVLPALQLVPTGSRHPRVLVVSPTRELAQQIEQVGHAVSKVTGHRVGGVVGGVKYKPQVDRLMGGVDLLVATPGRLMDLHERGDVKLDQIEILVLDEADRMLDMGFWPSIRRILRWLPAKRQNLLFSATMSDDVLGVVRSALHEPVSVQIAPKGSTAEFIEQAIMPVDHSQKPDLLAAVLRVKGADKVLVFTRTKDRADLVERILAKEGFKVAAMHADRSQSQREAALKDFECGKTEVLVATDVAARGIDISDITHVINYDVPGNPEDYVHRIGRTARAGASGFAYTFVGPDEITPLRDVEYLLGIVLPVHDLEGFPYRDSRIIPSETRTATRARRSVYGGRVMNRRRR